MRLNFLHQMAHQLCVCMPVFVDFMLGHEHVSKSLFNMHGHKKIVKLYGFEIKMSISIHVPFIFV